VEAGQSLRDAVGPGVPIRGTRTGTASWLARLAGHPVARALIRRIALSVPLLFLVSALVFVLTALTPSDLTEAVLGRGLPKAKYDAFKHQLGFDKPLYERYWIWLSHAFHGDLGVSALRYQKVTLIIEQRIGLTASLVFGTLLVSALVGVGLGVFSAVRGGAVGRGVDALAMTGWVVPVYWLAAMMVVVFAVKLRWFPATGYVPFAQSPVEWLRSLVLPVVALSLGPVGGFAKFTREAMVDALSSEYVRMARANGVRGRSIVLQHAFKTASVQVLTLLGLLTVGLLGGTVFVENVFGLPGLGSEIVLAIKGGDLPDVQGIAMLFTLIVVGVNLLVDLAYTLLSPRVRVT
jgi:peptide/nickel transport system permease protein